MKKQVSAILAAGMAASLLVGCGGAASSAASSTAESTSTAASSEAAATTEAGQAADITLWTYPIGACRAPSVYQNAILHVHHRSERFEVL